MVAANQRALDFYLRLGGKVTKAQANDIGGILVVSLMIVWTDLAPLLDRAGRP